MTLTLRIGVADDEPRVREFYQEILTQQGHQVVFLAQNGQDLVTQCHRHRPNLVITDIKMPDMDGIDAAGQINRLDPIPVILVTAYDDPELLERARENHVLAYLIKPIKKQDLQPAIAIAIGRHQEFLALQKETADLRQALQDRKIIERAKGVIMKRSNLDEAAAFQRLQKMARDSNRKLVQVAEMILAVEKAFGPNLETKGQN